VLTFRPESPAHFSTGTDQAHLVSGFVSVPITAYRGLRASFVEP
jgi:sulfur transfer protein SufE